MLRSSDDENIEREILKSLFTNNGHVIFVFEKNENDDDKCSVNVFKNDWSC